LDKPGIALGELLSATGDAVSKASARRQIPKIQGTGSRGLVLTSSANCSEAPPDQTPLSLNRAADCLVKKRKYYEAASLARQASEREPANAGYRLTLGLALAGDGDLDEGVAALREAVRLDPTLPRNRFELGSLLYLRAAYGEALSELKEAYRTAPDWPGLCTRLADAYEKTNNRPLAEQLRGSCR
jgi:tetratricopeptide (TPR) repeat protein